MLCMTVLVSIHIIAEIRYLYKIVLFSEAGYCWLTVFFVVGTPSPIRALFCGKSHEPQGFSSEQLYERFSPASAPFLSVPSFLGQLYERNFSVRASPKSGRSSPKILKKFSQVLPRWASPIFSQVGRPYSRTIWVQLLDECPFPVRAPFLGQLYESHLLVRASPQSEPPFWDNYMSATLQWAPLSTQGLLF